MSLLDTPLDVIETELPQSLPPLRGVASLRYSTSFEIQNALVNCAPCLLNDKETSVPPPAKSVLDLYKQLDKIFKSADAKDVQKAKVMEATSSWAKTASSDDWKRYLHWNEDHYTRNLIGATNEFEMLVICWKDKQKSRIHNHAGVRCFVAGLQGPLKEYRYENRLDRKVMETNDPANLRFAEIKPEDVVETGTGFVNKGDAAYIDDDEGLHAMAAESGDCVTLHIYSPPIRVSTVIEPENAMVMQRVPGFWSYGGVLLSQ